MSSTVIASSPLMMSHEGRRAAAAVVGLKMKYSTFYQHYVNSTTVSRRSRSQDEVLDVLRTLRWLHDGLKTMYSTFYEHYVNSTTSCRRTPSSDDNCNFTCRSPVSCASEMSRKFGAPGTSCTSTPYTDGRTLIGTGGVIWGGTFSPEKIDFFAWNGVFWWIVVVIFENLGDHLH